MRTIVPTTIDRSIKLRKVGKSHALIIPSKFLKDVGNSSDIRMKIIGNEIRLTFNKSKSLGDLIKEKRELNKLRQKEIKEILENLDRSKYLTDYIINSADDLIK